MASSSSCLLEYFGRIAVLRMMRGENRLTTAFMKEFTDYLEEVQKNDSVRVLVTTGEGKFYSNGLDITEIREGGPKYIHAAQCLFNKVLVFPKPTVAAINGHVYAGGAMMAMAHDFRIMRSDRGWFCLPEVKLGMPFSLGMMALLKQKLPKSEHINAIVLGKKYSGKEAFEAGIVHQVCSESQLLEQAIAFGNKLAEEDYNEAIMSQLKSDLHHDVSISLTESQLYHSKL